MPGTFPHSGALEAVVFSEGAQIARCLLRTGQYLIGQSRKCEIVVDEASVSTRHARLVIGDGEEITLEDLGSANGTLIDGRPTNGPTPVALASEVRIGSNTLYFCRGPLPAAAEQDWPADLFQAPRYQRGELVVQGSTSMIYEAQDRALGRTVAMKVLLPESQRNATTVWRFLREARLMGGLGHPGVLPIYDLGLDQEQRLYVTTRFMESEPLNGILDRLLAGDAPTVERWTFPALIGVWQKAADVIAFAHAQGVVHGHLRPEAIQVGHFGDVYVTHWTLARTVPLASGDPPRINVPASYELPPLDGFSAPEQAAGRAEDIDARTDVHALGGVLYRLITLRDPLEGATPEALLEAALCSRVAPPAELPKDAPHPHWNSLPEFPAAVAMKALSYEPDERQQTVAEMQQEIAAWQAGSGPGKDLGKIWKQFTGLLGQR